MFHNFITGQRILHRDNGCQDSRGRRGRSWMVDCGQYFEYSFEVIISFTLLKFGIQLLLHILIGWNMTRIFKVVPLAQQLFQDKSVWLLFGAHCTVHGLFYFDKKYMVFLTGFPEQISEGLGSFSPLRYSFLFCVLLIC